MLDCAFGGNVGEIVGCYGRGSTLSRGEEDDATSRGHVWSGFLRFVSIAKKSEENEDQLGQGIEDP